MWYFSSHGNRIRPYQYPGGGGVLTVSYKSPEVFITERDYENLQQVIIYEQGVLMNPLTGKQLIVNGKRVRAQKDESYSDIWGIEPFGHQPHGREFKPSLFKGQKGAWPFDCDKIIPCNGFEGQTCGCSDRSGSSPKAIVYYLGSGSTMAEKLNFQSCEDLKINSVVHDGEYLINGAKTYCHFTENKACPNGMELLDGRKCIKMMESLATKDGAESKCKEVHRSARLLTIKNHYEHQDVQDLITKQGIVSKIHLGLTKIDNQWIWSDGAPLFVMCKLINSNQMLPIFYMVSFFAVPGNDAFIKSISYGYLYESNRLPEYSIDGKIHNGEFTFLGQQSKLKLTLPEAILIKKIKVFTSMVRIITLIN